MCVCVCVCVYDCWRVPCNYFRTGTSIFAVAGQWSVGIVMNLLYSDYH